eukprot:TRINITY_DN194_c0_g1_i1.p1 TRINITY_DN194_c0_g1~~TRINITY_DN194_c0_g1_i1.p1  ORF type:complete len:211 (-),score=51.00 TRINITY_DN194_c0_g1_i1:65-652(-)
MSTARIGYPAPDFKGEAVVGKEFKEISLSDYKGKYLVLFFYPLDFTFVCPTEIISFSDRHDDFKKLNAEIVGVSVDSKYTHLAWIETPRKEGGLGELKYPLLSDIKKTIAQAYGALYKEEGFTLRALYIIDEKGIIRHITQNDPPVGRNTDEVLRLIQGYQYTDKHGEVCPMNWTPGKSTINPDPVAKKTYFEKV